MRFRQLDSSAELYGTSLQGYVLAEFSELVRCFGEPLIFPYLDMKTAVQWRLIIDDGTVASIYCWKEPAVPKGEYRWCIGGHSVGAVDHVTAILDNCTAHKHCSRHHDEVVASESCGCFFCCRVFEPSEIEEWVNDGTSDSENTALCPYCGIDCVLGSESGYPMEAAFLSRMNRHWFDRMVSPTRREQ